MRRCIRFRHLLAATLGALTLAGCQATNPYFDPGKSHHRTAGFQNNYLDFQPKGLAQLLRWRWEALREGLPPAPSVPTPTVPAETGFIAANARAGAAMEPAVTWIGHATVLAQFSGLNVLTDPMFSQRAFPVQFIGPRRAQPPGVALDQLPHIDLVLVSHNHYDHLDEASVRALNAQPGGPPLFVVPLGMKPWLADAGITHAVELDWWQTHRIGSPAGAVDVMLTPVQHWSARSLTDRMQVLWGGFAVLAPDFHLFFGGDTGYSKDFADIRTRLAERQAGGGFDLAILPVGGYEPRWFMADQHINPEEAVRVHRDLGARRSLGMHWGTFELTDEPLDEAPRALGAARQAQGVAPEDFFVLAVGQTQRLPRRAQKQP
jgi:N-acyl-phosphatidylethanolamine-hydrolysing phospholipase D